MITAALIGLAKLGGAFVVGWVAKKWHIDLTASLPPAEGDKTPTERPK